MSGLTFMLPFLALLLVSAIVAWSWVEQAREHDEAWDEWTAHLDDLVAEQDERLRELIERPPTPKPYDWSTEDDA